LLAEGNLTFLITAPRSGSTLLAHLLGKAPEIFAASEPWLMLGLEQLGRINPRHEYGAWHVSRAIDQFLSQNYVNLISAMARSAYEISLPPGKNHFLDKTPAYFWITDYLQKILPGANYVTLTRNPLAIAASFKSTWNMDFGDGLLNNSDIILAQCFTAIERVHAFAEQQRKTHPALVVDYDDLVAQPGQTVAQILQAIGLKALPVDWDALERIDVRELAATGYGDRKILETDRVHTQSRDAWKSVLTAPEAALIINYFDLKSDDLDRLAMVGGAAERAAMLRERLKTSLEQRQHDYRRSYELRMYDYNVNESIHNIYAGLI
jgi:hypothetical protein